MLLSRLAQNILESMSQIPVDELEFMSRSELLQLCKDHNVDHVEEKSNREIVQLLEALAAERSADNNSVRSWNDSTHGRASLSSATDSDSIMDTLVYTLGFKELPPIPTTEGGNGDSENGSEVEELYEASAIEESAAAPKDGDKPLQSAVLPETAAITAENDSHSEKAVSVASSSPKSSSRSSLVGTPQSSAPPSPQKSARRPPSSVMNRKERANSTVSVIGAAMAAAVANIKDAVAVKSEQSSPRSSVVEPTLNSLAEDRESEAGLDEEPLAKSVPLTARTDSQITLTDKNDAQLDEAHAIRTWLREHGLSAAKISMFEAEEMLEWQVLRAANLDAFRLLGLSVGRSLKLITAIQDQFPEAQRTLSAEQARDLSELIDQRVSHALDSMPRSTSPQSTSRTHTRSSSTARSVTDERLTPERKSTASERRNHNRRSTTPTSPPPFVTSFSLEEMKKSRKYVPPKPLPTLSSAKPWTKPADMPITETRSSLLRKMSRQQIRPNDTPSAEKTPKPRTAHKAARRTEEPAAAEAIKETQETSA
ncbi:hypothetical protein THASP1DRAFT_22049 [Thamnocephalis sphaerospora]|uniref:Uncharacterized protein n=1 Tax=Thamnocephalis sphaerospora TaxID=78915 RepID=A0A4P9XX16_9FUNG|nr:hypothetical protein THASP1DRAFT_22049 [Thamnocephalis sphaerospora]|eukprot:RKP10211.1 hypothetical protein THASP1DRAFT_22049 [Thamnocephalis sphaerospora]